MKWFLKIKISFSLSFNLFFFSFLKRCYKLKIDKISQLFYLILLYYEIIGGGGEGERGNYGGNSGDGDRMVMVTPMVGWNSGGNDDGDGSSDEMAIPIF